MKKYLQERLPLFLFLILSVALFALSIYLYHLPMKAVWYPSALCTLLFLIFIFMDYRYFRKKHETLESLTNMEAGLLELLTPFQSQTDLDYQAIIAGLEKLRNLHIQDQETAYADMMDYYTTWVHQIKTPIAAMKLTLSGEDTKTARKLSEQLFRIEQYVDMVLSYLRLNSESSDYVIQEYALDEILKPCLRKFRGEFIGKGIRLKYEENGERVITDEKWLAFVVEQLLTNALKYTVSGTITLAVKDEELQIADTGIGIAPEDLPRIFEKGYTGFNGRTDKKASGLGLYLCKQICTKMGHSIRATSTPGVGSIFYIGLSRERRLFD